MSKGKVYRLSISKRKGEKKYNVGRVVLETGQGIIGDAHATSDRPVSLLPYESFQKLSHPDISISPGDFAENITTEGLDFETITIGSKLQIGSQAELEIIQIGKECHEACPIRQTVGDCIMPKEGVFAKVIKGGVVQVGNQIEII